MCPVFGRCFCWRESLLPFYKAFLSPWYLSSSPECIKWNYAGLESVFLWRKLCVVLIFVELFKYCSHFPNPQVAYGWESVSAKMEGQEELNFPFSFSLPHCVLMFSLFASQPGSNAGNQPQQALGIGYETTNYSCQLGGGIYCLFNRGLMRH